LAGSFYHILLAARAAPLAFPEPGRRSDSILTAFAAGSVAPDLGFFPGGPSIFSQRVHHESTADCVRDLLAGAKTSEEEAFGLGWALHVITDIAIHPFINAEAARRGRADGSRDRRELWHKKLEWGYDCHALSSSAAAGMDMRVEALAHCEPGATFLKVAEALYGDDAVEHELRSGWRAMMIWIRRLLRILPWSGNVTTPRQSMLGLRPATSLVRGLGKLMECSESLDDAAAVARPHVLDAGFTKTMTDLGGEAVERYRVAVEERFHNLANLDLDTGQQIDPGHVQ
jgi:hypothetical protein